MLIVSEFCLVIWCSMVYSVCGVSGRVLVLKVGVVVSMFRCWFSRFSVLVECSVFCCIILVSSRLWFILCLLISDSLSILGSGGGVELVLKWVVGLCSCISVLVMVLSMWLVK